MREANTKKYLFGRCVYWNLKYTFGHFYYSTVGSEANKIDKYDGLSVIQNPVWSGQFWTNYCQVLPFKVLLLLLLFKIRYSSSPSRNLFWNWVLTFCMLPIQRISLFIGPNPRVIRTTPSDPYVVRMTKGLLWITDWKKQNTSLYWEESRAKWWKNCSNTWRFNFVWK